MWLKKIMLCLFMSTVGCTALSAEQCPSVSAIKHLSLRGQWKAYDSDTGVALSQKRLNDVLQAVDQFALAEWVATKNDAGTIHCYYRDKHGSNLEAYFSTDHYHPQNLNKNWYQVTGYMHCAAGMEKCLFQNDAVTQPPSTILAKTKPVHAHAT